MRFNYQATDPSGKNLYQGVVEATSFSEARALLRQRGLYPIKLVPLRSSPLRGVPLQELVFFTRRLALLLESSLPLLAALETLHAQSRHPSLKEALQGLRAQVEGGSSLAQAMEAYPQVFPLIMRRLVAVAELGGALEVVLRRLAGYLDRTHELREKVRTALTYPAFVLAVLLLVVVVLLVVVIPVFARLYQNSGIALPWPTAFLISSAFFVRQYGIFLLLAAILGGGVFWRAYQGPWGKAVDQRLFRLPLVGPILLKSALARFGHTLATLYKSGIALTQALEACAQVEGNRAFAEAIVQLRQAVEQGRFMSEAMRSNPLFLPLFVQMTQTGEGTGQMDRSLEQVADFFEQEIDHSLKRLSSSLEPLLTLVLGGVVLLVALALYLPVFDLSRVIRAR